MFSLIAIEESLTALTVFVVYDSKYGNTQNVAAHIVKGLKELDGVETALANIKDVDMQKIATYDALIIGAPNHMGQPSRAALKFVDGLSKVELNAKWGVAFDTYFQRVRNLAKAMRKLEKQMEKKLPKLTLVTPGLSIKVKGVNGPIAEGELSLAVDFGKRIGKQLKDLQVIA